MEEKILLLLEPESVMKLTHEQLSLKQHAVLRASELQNAVNGVKQKHVFKLFQKPRVFKAKCLNTNQKRTRSYYFHPPFCFGVIIY